MCIKCSLSFLCYSFFLSSLSFFYSFICFCFLYLFLSFPLQSKHTSSLFLICQILKQVINVPLLCYWTLYKGGKPRSVIHIIYCSGPHDFCKWSFSGIVVGFCLECKTYKSSYGEGTMIDNRLWNPFVSWLYAFMLALIFVVQAMCHDINVWSFSLIVLLRNTNSKKSCKFRETETSRFFAARCKWIGSKLSSDFKNRGS